MLRLLMTQLRIFSGLQINMMCMVWLVLRLTLTGWQRPELRDAELLIAVTESDEVNMVACQVSHTIFNTPVKIARIRSNAYLDPAFSALYSAENLPIDHIISPEAEVLCIDQ